VAGLVQASAVDPSTQRPPARSDRSPVTESTAILPPLGVEEATAILHGACDVLGLDPSGAALVRLGSNAVFRLASSPAIIRVSRPSNGLSGAQRQVAVARWLADNGVPAIVAMGVRQPIVVAGRAVTAWESVSSEERYGTTAELGELLRRLHALPTPELGLPNTDPAGDPDAVRGRIANLFGVDPDDRAMLAERYSRIVDDYRQRPPALPRGVIHGDANVGNLLRADSGGAVLSDLDAFGIGPREWDLVQTAMYYERFGWHTQDEYRAFVDSYGFDLLTWPGYSALADLREVLMVVWLAGTAETDATALPELATRVKALRTDVSRRDWKPR
jgi:aminoglycoside phosphotransferase (APT) family kinase protein